MSLNLFTQDHDDKYPPSLATIGQNQWQWSDPRTLVSQSYSSFRTNRSIASYLKEYIDNVTILSCPCIPEKPQYLKDLWQAGDNWNNPDTPEKDDLCIGSYCFYWNYIGFIENREPFIGPQNQSDSQHSKLLISDYFGRDHWRYPKSFASCQPFKSFSSVQQSATSFSFWASQPDPNETNLQDLDLKLNATFTDGHTETYSPSQTAIMQVSIDQQGTTPYPDDIGPGQFYLPLNILKKDIK
jgi:hypothetical protein